MTGVQAEKYVATAARESGLRRAPCQRNIRGSPRKSVASSSTGQAKKPATDWHGCSRISLDHCHCACPHSVVVIFGMRANRPASMPASAARASVIICTGRISSMGRTTGGALGRLHAPGPASSAIHAALLPARHLPPVCSPVARRCPGPPSGPVVPFLTGAEPGGRPA